MQAFGVIPRRLAGINLKQLSIILWKKQVFHFHVSMSVLTNTARRGIKREQSHRPFIRGTKFSTTTPSWFGVPPPPHLNSSSLTRVLSCRRHSHCSHVHGKVGLLLDVGCSSGMVFSVIRGGCHLRIVITLGRFSASELPSSCSSSLCLGSFLPSMWYAPPTRCCRVIGKWGEGELTFDGRHPLMRSATIHSILLSKHTVPIWYALVVLSCTVLTKKMISQKPQEQCFVFVMVGAGGLLGGSVVGQIIACCAGCCLLA